MLDFETTPSTDIRDKRQNEAAYSFKRQGIIKAAPIWNYGKYFVYSKYENI